MDMPASKLSFKRAQRKFMKKVYAIFGATGGIGSVLVEKLLNPNNVIYLLGKNREKLEELSNLFSLPYITVDASNEESVSGALEEIKGKEKQIDGVASLVGSIFLKPLINTTQKEFEEVMKINTTSSFCILKHSLRLMQTGSIVLSSSTAALIGLSHHESIAAAKSAVLGLITSAAASYANKGIRVNAVAPGLIKTSLSDHITTNESTLKTSISLHPLGRIGKPEEVANAIYWLLSDESSFVTGEVIAVDGGLSSIKLKL